MQWSFLAKLVFSSCCNSQTRKTFSGETIDPSQYFNDDNPVLITGATSGVTAKVVGFTAGTSDEQPLLHIAYQSSGSDFETASFVDGENISANAGITHTTSYATDVASATTFTSPLNIFKHLRQSCHLQLVQQLERGNAVKIEAGVYYVRGHFVQ